ncbi:MAG: ribonuclease P protein component [Alphaproteobacteria bacterium]|nr:ribonuclease P protein component [Alphaproteobacteria bacterium]
MRDTIKKHKDFARAETDITFGTPFFVARSRPTLWPGNAQYGLIATKKTLKNATDRNRAKRLLRAWIRANESLMSPDMDYIFIVRTPILEATLSEGNAMMKRALKKLATDNQL